MLRRTIKAQWIYLFPLRSISLTRGFCLVFIITMTVFNANTVETYQTQCSVASDMGLHSLSMTFLCDALWVNTLPCLM